MQCVQPKAVKPSKSQKRNNYKKKTNKVIKKSIQAQLTVSLSYSGNETLSSLLLKTYYEIGNRELFCGHT
jgi:hypothetical protein